MLLNRLLGRRGHFWEGRYHAVAVPDRPDRHALTVLRYIHANPLAAGLAPGFRYRYANYASYADARTDGLTDWHPAYLRLGPSLTACARSYAGFCRRYRPAEKPVSTPRWGAWRLWTTYGQGGRAQADLFGDRPDHGGSRCQARRGVILRAGLLAEVAAFCRVNG